MKVRVNRYKIADIEKIRYVIKGKEFDKTVELPLKRKLSQFDLDNREAQESLSMILKINNFIDALKELTKVTEIELEVEFPDEEKYHKERGSRNE